MFYSKKLIFPVMVSDFSRVLDYNIN